LVRSIADIVAKLSAPASKAPSTKSSGKKKDSADILQSQVEAMVAAYLTKGAAADA